MERLVVQRVPITARGRRLTPVTGSKLECGGGEHKPWVCRSVLVFECVRAYVHARQRVFGTRCVCVCVEHRSVLWNDSCRGVELLSQDAASCDFLLSLLVLHF